MKGSERPSRSGHPPVDIAWRLRNWAWYWTIKQITGCSDDGLDTRYVPEGRDGARKRFFQRVRSLGSDPATPREDLGGESVFQQIHHGVEADRVRTAEIDFRSRLWEMLANPRLRVEDHRQYIKETIAAREWYRVGAEDRRIAAAFLTTDPLFGFPEGSENVYSAMLMFLETHPTADHVALLAALFREAIAEVALEQAALLKESLLVCARKWVRKLGMANQHRRLLILLVEQRLIYGRWFTPDLTLKAYGSQRRYIKAQIDAHLATTSAVAEESHAKFPIALRSPRVAWMDAHREILETAANKLYGPQSIRSWQPGDPGPTDFAYDPVALQAYFARLMEEEKAWHDYAAWAERTIEPPPQDMRYCLPVNPGSQDKVHGRPLPFLADGRLDTLQGRQTMRDSRPTWQSTDPPPPLRYSFSDDESDARP